MNRRAFTLIEVIAVVALLGLGGTWLKVKFFNGDAKRAKAAAAANSELIASKDAQSAAAASSVTKMVEVAATMPPTWETEFFGLEGAVALSYLQKPDPLALARAEARKTALARGERDEARRLYALENVRAGEAEQRAHKAEIQTAKVIDELQRVAAERQGAEMTRNIVILVALLAGGLWAWTKFTHLSPGAVAELRNDLAAVSPNALGALDTITSRLQQAHAKRARKKAEKAAAISAVNLAP